MCQHIGAFCAEYASEAREDQTRDASVVAGLYVESCTNRLKRIEQLALESTPTGDVQVVKPVNRFGVVDESNNTPTSPGYDENDASAGPSSA